MLQNDTYIVDFESYDTSVSKVLQKAGLNKYLQNKHTILLKPNLVDNLAFPVTTHPDCVRFIIRYIRKYTRATIIIAEGTGTPESSTTQIFDSLGYTKMSKEENVDLLDLNTAPVVKLSNPNMRILKEYYIPQIALDSFIINIPVLKAHSYSTVTLALKNMMGFAPPQFYQKDQAWRKTFFHQNIHESIIEMNQYRSSDFVLLDATVGLSEYHLGGKRCFPPVGKLVAGPIAAEVDLVGAELLGFDWEKIPHIANMAKIEKFSYP